MPRNPTALLLACAALLACQAAADTVDIGGSTITMRQTTRPGALAELVFDNRAMNNETDSGAYCQEIRATCATDEVHIDVTFTADKLRAAVAGGRGGQDVVVRCDGSGIMSAFGKAFADARRSLGPGKTFTFNGKSYSTNTAEDKPSKMAPAASKRPMPRPVVASADVESNRPMGGGARGCDE